MSATVFIRALRQLEEQVKYQSDQIKDLNCKLYLLEDQVKELRKPHEKRPYKRRTDSDS